EPGALRAPPLPRVRAPCDVPHRSRPFAPRRRGCKKDATVLRGRAAARSASHHGVAWCSEPRDLDLHRMGSYARRSLRRWLEAHSGSRRDSRVLGGGVKDASARGESWTRRDAWIVAGVAVIALLVRAVYLIGLRQSIFFDHLILNAADYDNWALHGYPRHEP